MCMGSMQSKAFDKSVRRAPNALPLSRILESLASLPLSVDSINFSVILKRQSRELYHSLKLDSHV